MLLSPRPIDTLAPAPQGFALFSSAAAARHAVEVTTQTQFDESTVLRVEMAHKNMFLKDDPSIKRAGPGGLGRLSMSGALNMNMQVGRLLRSA